MVLGELSQAFNCPISFVGVNSDSKPGEIKGLSAFARCSSKWRVDSKTSKDQSEDQRELLYFWKLELSPDK